MEEDRVGLLYWNLLKRRVSGCYDWMFPRGPRNSSWLPGTLVVVLVLGSVVGWRMHRRGRFSTLKAELGQQVGTPSPIFSDPGKPGGQDPIVLERQPSPATGVPEFVSTTLLPGLGMAVLQITASVPGRGPVALLAAPTVEEVGRGTNGLPAGPNDNHGSFELPWAGALMGPSNPLGTSVTASWQARSIEVSTESSGMPGVAQATSLATLGADAAKRSPAPGGMAAESLFRAVNPDGRWFSQTDVTIDAQLTAQHIDWTVTAKNTGTQAEPIGIGWHPRFVLPSSRRTVQIRLPAGQVVEIADSGTRLPSGNLRAPTLLEPYVGQLAPLGACPADTTVTGFEPEPGPDTANSASSSRPAVELRDPDAGYGLRLVALSPVIRAFSLHSPAAAGYLALGVESNLDDPLGRQWHSFERSGMIVLEPGQTLVWKVRLEIFAVGKSPR